MRTYDYEYLLPVFVGHPFHAASTAAVRAAVQRVCDTLNAGQKKSQKRFLWAPEFAFRLDETRLQTVLTRVRELIRHSALTIFDVNAKNANVFFELGMAVGMNQPTVLLGRKPFAPPADLRGFRGIEYTNEGNLARQLEQVLHTRLKELHKFPSSGQDVIYQKMQIDASWHHRIRRASESLYFLAGDLSWATTLREDLREAVRRGVTICVCCKSPDPSEKTKWDNVGMLSKTGAKVKLFGASLDPRIRGFISDPAEPANAEALFVEKERRNPSDGCSHLENTGVTIGESEYVYKGQIFRAETHPKILTAIIRLFEAIWSHRDVREYPRKSRSRK